MGPKRLYSPFSYLLHILKDQRGEVGDIPDPDDLPDGMTVDDDGNVISIPDPDDDAGDYAGDDPTGGDHADDDDSDSDDDDSGQRIPDGDDPDPDDDGFVRVSKDDYSALQLELEEFRNGTHGKEPGPAPGNGGPPSPMPPGPTPPSTPYDEAIAAPVKFTDESHPYNGKTLGEIFDLDPAMAYQIDPYRATTIQLGKAEASRTVALEEEAQRSAIRTQIKQERTDFGNEFAQSQFKSAYSSLTPDQQSQIDDLTVKVEEWMVENGKVGITISDGYYLMDRAGHASRIVKDLVKTATQQKVVNVRGKKEEGGEGDGPDADMSKWTEDQMMAHLEGMSRSERVAFYAKAPKSVQKAFPSLPWK